MRRGRISLIKSKYNDLNFVYCWLRLLIDTVTHYRRQPPPLPKGFLMWILTLLRIPDVELIRIMGLDRFMVLKFLRMGIVVFTLYMLVAIPILIPVNVINQRNSPGLNVMTMGNIKDASRTWAHLVLSVLLTGKRIFFIKIFLPWSNLLICLFLSLESNRSAGVIFYTFYETRRFLNLRRAFLLRPEYANSVTARTLYVPSIPKSVNNVQDLAKIFSKFPGGIRRIWLTRYDFHLWLLTEEDLRDTRSDVWFWK